MQRDFETYAGEIRRGLAEDRREAETFSAAVGGSVETETPEWSQPQPFEEIHLPEFPVDCLPGPIARFVEALSETTQTPLEMGGILALGVLATAFQGRYTVQLTPDWWEPLCLYGVAVAPPGERKSAVISALMRPVYQYEADRQKEETPEIAKNRTAKKILEGQLQAAESAAIKDGGKRDEALEIASVLAGFEELHPYRLLADDTTPEKLADLLDQHRGSLTITSSEGGVFDSMAGRYDRNLNIDIYLKAHAGDYISTDRIGRKGNNVSDPRLTMILTVQPDVIAGIMSNRAFRGRGLCGRFLYAMCRSKVGRRSVTSEPIAGAVKKDYTDYIRRILSDSGTGIVFLSREAFMLFQDFRAENERMLGEYWQDRGMCDWAGKLEGATARIAALIHCGSVDGDPVVETISQNTMSRAIMIASFLQAHAEAAYQTMGADAEIESAKFIVNKLRGWESITRSELTRLCRGKFKRAREMDPAITLLEEMNYIRPVREPIGYNSRNQLSYEINPLLYGK